VSYDAINSYLSLSLSIFHSFNYARRALCLMYGFSVRSRHSSKPIQ